LRYRADLARSDRTLLGPVLWVALPLGLISSFVIPAIDPYAHLGGVGAGVIAGLGFRRRRPAQEDADV
jgi:membrane associated rhomboid family serine protease